MPSPRIPFVLILILGSLLTSPAPADAPSHDDAAAQLEVAAAEIDAIQGLALEIYDPTLRRAIFSHVRNAELAVHQARYELEYGGWDHGTPAPSHSYMNYSDARTLVMRESFDSGRLEAIKGAAKNGRFTTDEARALVGLCTFDSYKTDALIALYPAVTDPQRYLLALDVLDFDSSRREVQDALDL